MSDTDIDLDEDHDVDYSHSKLLKAAQSLDKIQRIKKPERSEPSLEVSEFHLIKSGISDKNIINLQELAKTLGKKGYHDDIAKQFKKARNKAKVLPKPLEKPVEDRIKRKTGFEKVKKDLGRWDGIVARNRTVQNITFPLTKPSIKLNSQKDITNKFRLKSDLEIELENLEPKEKVETYKNEEEYSMTMEELLEKRKEASKLRAQQSYKAAKARRQNKIKSKKFHRVQRKEKLKQQIKEFENLQKNDPEAALEKLEQLDKIRAKERISLRHKNTGQWAKNKQVRAKYDKESREALAQQLSISRELTQKIKNDEDSDEDDDDSEVPAHVTETDKDNPWISSVKTESEISKFVNEYKKYWEEKNKEKEENKEKEQSNVKNIQNEGDKDETSEEENNDSLDIHSQITASKLPPGINPVEDIIVTHSDKYCDVKENKNNSDHSELDNSENEKYKNVVRKKVSKSKKIKKVNNAIVEKENKIDSNPTIQSTSQWSVESVNNDTDKRELITMDIDDLFNSLESKIEQRVNNKMNCMQKKFQAEERKTKKRTKDNTLVSQETDDYLEKLNFKRSKVNPIIDEPLQEGRRSSNEMKINNNNDQVVEITDLLRKQPKPNEAEIDPNKYINMKTKYIKTQIPSAENTEALDDTDNEEEQHKIISEAFADDDIVDEFRKEKEEEIKKSQPEDIDLTLPGWGSWGGTGVVPLRRKSKRFMIKFPKNVPRRDENKGDVIIYEESSTKIRQHQVSDVPFPFKNVKDFEYSIRQPIGRNFVPEKVHRALIEPAVKTKMGKVIEPMDENALVSKLNKKKKLFL